MLQAATFFRTLQQSIATTCGKRCGKCRSRTVLSVRISTPQRKIPRRGRHCRAGLRAAGRRRFHRLHDRGKDRAAGAGVRHRRSRPDRSPDCRGGLSYRENRRRVRRPTNGGAPAPNTRDPYQRRKPLRSVFNHSNRPSSFAGRQPSNVIATTIRTFAISFAQIKVACIYTTSDVGSGMP